MFKVYQHITPNYISEQFTLRTNVNISVDVRSATACCFIPSKIVSEYDQEIPQSQTADNPVAPRGRAAKPSRDTRKTN